MENMQLCYRDNEGDWISITDDMDIAHAASLSSVITVTVNDMTHQTDGVALMNAGQSKSIREQLVGIRSVVDGLLKQLDSMQVKEATKDDDGVESKEDQAKEAPKEPSIKPLSTTDMGKQSSMIPLIIMYICNRQRSSWMAQCFTSARVKQHHKYRLYPNNNHLTLSNHLNTL